ncbi:hypothetical protein AGR13a_Lc90135 [Agrobacterium genomosp. 13 str. CFBP 6927]|uniref:Transposase n=1 Tax=Agrobacterium genomosp. 13 str. CFBP 6927 TaxID=1183428 RepID=A0ABP2BRP5_9HYPH|nr:hypothetical protein AGR5A_Lc70223 [Agrobacterium genomosp. 5 str. CFBP 6626]CUX64137.1 hypothetical protein AGR13a_Lc90135 [Agrobacterium genomosp. 13 str. CFBP 6927]
MFRQCNDGGIKKPSPAAMKITVDYIRVREEPGLTRNFKRDPRRPMEIYDPGCLQK